jgi:6-phosphogluconolactonase
MLNSRFIPVFVGSYADALDPGYCVCVFDTHRGTVELKQAIEGLHNPTFAAADRVNDRVYVLSERLNEEGHKVGQATAFAFDSRTWHVEEINTAATVSGSTCHIALDHTGSAVIVSSYHKGCLGISPIEQDGSIGTLQESHTHQGSSVHPAQTQARVHSACVDRNNTYVIVCDLGTDHLIIYRLDAIHRTLVRHREVPVAAGAGPRHFTFHPTLPFGYVINELNATIIVFRYDEELGSLQEVQTVPTLPESYSALNACADIHVSPDGRFLYGSNRGHDSIVVYAVHVSEGTLTYVEHVPTGGGHPRNFALSPDGRFVLVANRDGNHIVTFSRDVVTGRLIATGDEFNVPKPVCITFF